MTAQAAALVALTLFAGTTLLLSELRWFRRRPLVDRVAPYVPGGAEVRRRGSVLSAVSFAEAIGPLARAVGERLARAFGVTEPLAVRLERVHSPLDVTAFRVRQLAWAVAGVVLAGLVAVASGLSGLVALAFVLGGPVLAFLLVEQQLATESARWQRRIFLELPVVAEQLGMLLVADQARRAPRADRDHRAAGPAGVDPRHGRRPRARRHLPRGAVHRGPAPVLRRVTPHP